MTIAQHNQQIDQLIDGTISAAQSELDQLLARLDQILVDNPGVDISSTATLALLGLGASTAALISGLNSLLEQYATLGELDYDSTVATSLSTAVRDSIASTVTSVGNEIVAAAIIGSILGNSRTAINTNLKSVRDRGKRAIGITITESIMTAHGAFGYRIAKLAGITKFKYAGGTISTTRDFCQTHNNRTYTTKEIKNIWKGSWGGKRPGDPFVVRGGWNCRHYFVPVK